MSVKMGHLAIKVKDMDASVEFYSKCFGFKKAFDIPNPSTKAPWIVYLYMGGDQFFELFYGGEDLPENKGTDCGFQHICLITEDMDKDIENIEKGGYSLSQQPKMGSDGNRQCWITDPNGIKIELMQLGNDSLQMKIIQGKA